MKRRRRSFSRDPRHKKMAAIKDCSITLPEVADRCGVTQMTLRRWLSQGQFPPPSRIGRTWYWTFDSLESVPRSLPCPKNTYPTVAEFANAAGYLGTDE